MKRLFLLLLTALIVFGCSEDNCMETAQVQYLRTGKTTELITIINEDTCIDGDYHVEGALRVNYDYTLTVLGELSTEGSLMFVGDGTVQATSSIQIGGSAFFLNGGNMKADKALVIQGHAKVQSELGGTIKYCDFYSIGDLDESIVLTQDCDSVVECKTLSIGGVGVINGEMVEVPCGFDYNNQKVKTTPDGSQYLYIKI